MSFETRAFRDALGRFVTGVTIITTRLPDGTSVGVTANSFNSVSMTPPLVLWSLGQSSRNYANFLAATHFCVHVLSDRQESLSRRFSTAGIDRFAGLDLESGLGNVPMLTGCAARFECAAYANYAGGDHTIFLGEVMRLASDPGAHPLLYHAGQYDRLAGHASNPLAD
jgi:flavin reductase (DIM6/NTAB) family NADH-FMN oxidoreductase RutF